MFALIDSYIDERIGLGQFSHQSAQVVRSTLRNVAKRLGGDLSRLDRSAVTSWLAEAEVAPTTVKSRLTKLRPFCRWLVREGHLVDDPTAEIPIPRIPQRLPRALPTDAVARVIAACPDARARLIVVLMAQLGLRVGEVAVIQVRDVDEVRRVLQVRGKGGRGEVTRAVPFTDEAWEALVAYRAEVGVQYSGRLIVSYNAAQPGVGVDAHTISKMVRRWFSAAGVKVHAYDGMSSHALRHTCAQDVADSGADLRHVQELLGHRSLRTTQDYLRLNPPGLAHAISGRRYGDVGLVGEVSGPRMYECEDCGRPFRLAAGLARHRQASHDGSATREGS